MCLQSGTVEIIKLNIILELVTWISLALVLGLLLTSGGHWALTGHSIPSLDHARGCNTSFTGVDAEV
jgi:hypothetical protein